MSKKLLIVESPAKAKTISKYLEGEYDVVASVGHIRDLPKTNKDAVDIEGGFIPRYVISPGKEKVVADIVRKAKTADEVLLATDPDREGEAIAWHIAQAAKLKHPKRVVFYEITKPAVQEAVLKPRDIDDNLRQAQEARRVLDRLFGYDLSGLIWKKVRYGLSAGRVQSPALRILVEREREIRAFIPEAYFSLAAQVRLNSGIVVPMHCDEEPRDAARAESIVAAANSKKWSVAAADSSEASRSPRAPFTTSTLQQTASSRLGYSPSRTMQLAQRLYEAGHITYMRTDSTNISKIAMGEAGHVIAAEFGKDSHQPRTFSSKSKNVQEAHEAVRPTSVSKREAGADPQQKALYRLIRARFLASQMVDAKLLRSKVTIATDDTAMATFSATGTITLSPGWLAADPDAAGEDVKLPKCTVGDAVSIDSCESTAKETQPPSRYTEAGLVKELEKREIGRPSTYASTIKTIQDREYVTKEGKSLKPTDTGELVSGFLENHFASYISDDFTAKMEDELDEIANGNRSYEETLTDFYGPFTKEIASKAKIEKATNIEKADDKFKCPVCGAGMVVKLGRGGKFLSCERFPDCNGALSTEGVELKPDEPIGFHPDNGMPIFVKTGRYGPYVQLGANVPKKKKVAKKKVAKKKGTKKGTVEDATTDTVPEGAATLAETAPEPAVEADKPRMSSIPKGKDLATVTVADALRYLSLPRRLGQHPDTGKAVTANVGRFGPYVVHDGDFRSLKGDDNPYDVTFERAIEIFSQPKAVRKGFVRKAKK
jgi:DNA topoisomerase-1